jgi:hypothetical protein
MDHGKKQSFCVKLSLKKISGTNPAEDRFIDMELKKSGVLK